METSTDGGKKNGGLIGPDIRMTPRQSIREKVTVHGPATNIAYNWPRRNE
jgi:hypothetical protein